ncbi:MAG: UDP-N-acetyl-D-glucosamine dehydrogenase [Spirochaetae bacterium HGW-Spirochaetae-1]|jgi:UDP-N-acetyl-D-glucosamine dehydrogenase|nr:MAG: UDP-N-acetyl-D-glucosamine dehydrogenase [Spirochaetae bacterium HGW-Spirochaetae-1]
MSSKEALIQRINENKEIVGILGLGYVGLPLAVVFAKKGIQVLGFEKSEKKAQKVNKGENYIGDVDDNDLKAVVDKELLSATTNFARIKECDALIICVPTPLDRFKKPDMSYIENSCHEIGKNIKKGVFVSLESTTYPTTTENVMRPIIEKESGLICEKDFWLAFSPERVDPGNHLYKTENTPKVLGGIGADAVEIGKLLYEKVISQVYPVSSPRAAEMVKILENTYRLVNISLINELALLAGRMDIDIWEVIDAAKTKPFGFQPFYPGPGIGGHCIPLDPFYLEYIAKNYRFNLSMINAAGTIDDIMPHRMFVKINFALNRHKKAVNGSKILFLGVAYKADINDERESAALKIIDETVRKMGEVMYHDPYIPEIVTEEGRSFSSVELTDKLLEEVDCVVIVTPHKVFDMKRIVDKSKLLVDLRNATKGIAAEGKIFKL